MTYLADTRIPKWSAVVNTALVLLLMVFPECCWRPTWMWAQKAEFVFILKTILSNSPLLNALASIQLLLPNEDQRGLEPNHPYSHNQVKDEGFAISDLKVKVAGYSSHDIIFSTHHYPDCTWSMPFDNVRTAKWSVIIPFKWVYRLSFTVCLSVSTRWRRCINVTMSPLCPH